MSEILYSSTAITYGGVEGKVQSSDGVINMDTAMPGTDRYEELEHVTNPEQLFAAAYATCFDNALQIVAKKERLSLESQVTANVKLLDDGNDGYRLSVNLQIKGTNIDNNQLDMLVEKANHIWPYSEEKRKNMEISFKIDTLSH